MIFSERYNTPILEFEMFQIMKSKLSLNGQLTHLPKEMTVKNNVLKIGPVTELEKLPVHGSLVGPMVEPWLNR